MMVMLLRLMAFVACKLICVRGAMFALMCDCTYRGSKVRIKIECEIKFEVS